MFAHTRIQIPSQFDAPTGRRIAFYGIAILLGVLVGGLVLFLPPLYLLLGIGGLILAYLIFFDVQLAVVLTLLVLEQMRDYNYMGGGSPFHPNGLIGLALIFGAAWMFAFSKIRYSRLVFIKYFLAFLVVSFLSLLFAGSNWFEGLTIGLRLACGFAIYVILLYKTDSIRRIWWVLGAILIALLYPTITGLVAIAQGQGSSFFGMGTARLGGGTSGPGVSIAMILSLCVVFLFDATTNAKRLLWGAICAVLLVGLFFSYARAGWMAFLAGLLLIATVKYKRLWFLLPGLVLLVILILPQLSQRFSDMSLSQLGNRNSSTLAMRIQLWNAGIQVFKDSNPLFGVGYGAERYRIGEYLSRYPWMAHNDYIAVLVGTGLIGLILFLLWHGQWFVQLVRSYQQSAVSFDKTLALATLTVLFVSLVARLTDNILEPTGRLYPLVALVAVTFALRRIRVEERARETASASTSNQIDAPEGAE